MTPSPTIDAARSELGSLLLERADRLRVVLVTFPIIAGLAAVALPFAGAPPLPCRVVAGGLGLFAILVGFRVIPVSGQFSRFRQDRIAYLQAFIAAHDASSSNPAIPRQPRSRARSLPSTVDSSVDTVRT